MPDTITSLQRHNNMARIRGKDTSPELKVRSWLHRHGYRFRVNVHRLPGTPDIVLARYRTCIFVNGCFWHGHDGCRNFTHPKSNPEFWEDKVARNKLRDQIAEARLEAARWNVLTIWECELKKDAFEQTMERLSAGLQQNRETWLSEIERRRDERAIAKDERTARLARHEALMAGFNIPKSIRRLSEQEED